MYKRETIPAIDNYRKAIAIDKNNAFAHNNLGRAYREQGKTQKAVDEYNKKAIDEYNKAATIDSHDPYAHLNLGSVFYDKGSPTLDSGFLTQAIDEYKTAIAIDPRNSDAHVRLGLAFRAEGKHEEEKNEYDNALAISALRHF
jgi:tetratricopeptide (TPR) repeat protein